MDTRAGRKIGTVEVVGLARRVGVPAQGPLDTPQERVRTRCWSAEGRHGESGDGVRAAGNGGDHGQSVGRSGLRCLA